LSVVANISTVEQTNFFENRWCAATAKCHQVVRDQKKVENHYIRTQGGSRGGIGAITPLKNEESTYIHHVFLQFGKLHSRYKVILSSTVLLQQYCERYFIPLTVAKLLW